MKDERAEFYKIRAEIEATLAKDQRSAVIEECARVVEELCSKRDCSVWEIVEAIRALKDKP